MGSASAPSPIEVPRFCGISTFMRLPHTTDLDGIDFAVIGVPYDTATTWKVGQRFAPAAIRAASFTLRPFNQYLGVNVLKDCRGADYGDTTIFPGNVPRSFKSIEATVSTVLDAGAVPVLLGGDHGITLPELRAVAKRYGPVCVVQLDSHTDLWDEYYGEKVENHGTWVRRAIEAKLIDVSHSIQVGLRGTLYGVEDVGVSKQFGLQALSMEQVRERGIPAVAALIKETVGTRPAFMTFDMDFVDAAHSPATTVPEFGGPTGGEALELVRRLSGLKFVGYDVVELQPQYDGSGLTSWLAASATFEFISLLAKGKMGGRGRNE